MFGHHFLVSSDVPDRTAQTPTWVLIYVNAACWCLFLTPPRPQQHVSLLEGSTLLRCSLVANIPCSHMTDVSHKGMPDKGDASGRESWSGHRRGGKETAAHSAGLTLKHMHAPDCSCHGSCSRTEHQHVQLRLDKRVSSCLGPGLV